MAHKEPTIKTDMDTKEIKDTTKGTREIKVTIEIKEINITKITIKATIKVIKEIKTTIKITTKETKDTAATTKAVITKTRDIKVPAAPIVVDLVRNGRLIAVNSHRFQIHL